VSLYQLAIVVGILVVFFVNMLFSTAVKQLRFDGHSERNQSVPEGESNDAGTAQDLQPGV